MMIGRRIANASRELRRAARLDPLRFADIPGFFPTPPDLAARLVAAADLDGPCRILEPSAGIGSLAGPLRDHIRDRGGELVVVEQNLTLVQVLKDEGYGEEESSEANGLPRWRGRTRLVAGDCLEDLDDDAFSEPFDAIVMNPPFEKRQDEKHVRALYESRLAPGGRLVALVTPRAAGELREDLPGVLPRDHC